VESTFFIKQKENVKYHTNNTKGGATINREARKKRRLPKVSDP
jgi:hypothetical protein